VVVEEEEEEEEEDSGEKLNLRLQRRDTPHHLKNKRITSGTADPDTLQAILQKVYKLTNQIN
jgi:hypothetical protein